MAFVHQSVLLMPAVEALAIRPDGIYLDGTLGGAGHSYEIASRLTTGRLIGLDRDEGGLGPRPESGLKPFSDRGDAGAQQLPSALSRLGRPSALPRWTGMLFDLGVSLAPAGRQGAGAFPTWPTRRWTCAWIEAKDSRPTTWSTPTTRNPSSAFSTPTARSATRPRSPLPSSKDGAEKPH